MRSIVRHHEDFHNLPLFYWSELIHRRRRRARMTGYCLDKWSTVTPILGEEVR